MAKRTRKRTRGESKSQVAIPVRLCCGKRHSGAQCPDGKMMCCLCYERFDMSKFHVLSDGCVEDVCRACNEVEEAEMHRRQEVLHDFREKARKAIEGERLPG